jgi:hypothetical protein
MSITKGEGALGRIYERLRKRSYRKMVWFSKKLSPFGGLVDMELGDYWYDSIDHEAYIMGVRDALQAVEAGDLQKQYTAKTMAIAEAREARYDPITGGFE